MAGCRSGLCIGAVVAHIRRERVRGEMPGMFRLNGVLQIAFQEIARHRRDHRVLLRRLRHEAALTWMMSIDFCLSTEIIPGRVSVAIGERQRGTRKSRSSARQPSSG